jgi:hypothetical protein
MSTDTLDTRIRRAVVQVVETSPPPPLLGNVALRQDHRGRRRRLVPALVGVVLAIATVAIVGFIGFITSRHDQAVAPAQSAPPVAHLSVEALASISYDRDSYTVPAGRVHVRLSGATGHTFTIDSPTTRDLVLTTDAGGRHDATVTLRPGTYTMGSTVPGHRAAGMVTTLRVLRRPVRWVTRDGAADASIVLPGPTTDGNGPPGPIGTELQVLATRYLQGDREATTPPDVSTDRLLGPIGRTTLAYPHGDRFDIVAFGLPHPVSAATLGGGHTTRFAVTTGRSRLVFVDDLATVFLVRPDGTVARITESATDPGVPVQTIGLVGLAEALDRPALDRAVG